MEKDWKLKLRYGKTKTTYHHYTIIAEGIAGNLAEGFSCAPGDAFMGMKVWASDHDEAIDMIQSIGRQIGFNTTGKIEIFNTEPVQPPEDNPYGYDITFTSFKE